ncbi:MAG: glycosyltransferase [Bacteroidia bacterium]
MFSIIVPSYNQDKFIRETLENLRELKAAHNNGSTKVQLIVVDNCSNRQVQAILNEFKPCIDHLIIEKDKGQYDAINKGLKLVKGDYWTWLNTDDLIDTNGFAKIVSALEQEQPDYIYGNVAYIDEHSEYIKASDSGLISLDRLVNEDASISQPGSFFKTAFTNTIGELAPYHFAFDYEYILRCLKHKASLKKLDCTVALFRYYTASKSGSQDYRFLSEQRAISKLYGSHRFGKLRLMLSLRILKRKLFN